MTKSIIYSSANYDEYEFKSKRIWRTDGKYEPFVYIIQEVETEMMYIGSRTRYSKPSCLESDLGSIYFTSSKQFDWESEPSSFEICRIIPCASNHDAIILESVLIKQNGAVWDDDYYNRHDPFVGFNTSGLTFVKSDKERKRMSEFAKTRTGDKNPFYGRRHSLEYKRYMSKINSGERNHRYGKKNSEQMRKRISEANTGKVGYWRGKTGENTPHYGFTHTEETKKTISDKAKQRKRYKCEYCDKRVTKCMYVRWHGDRCKHSPYSKTKLIECPYCGKIGESNGGMKTWHFDNCKERKYG